MLELAAQDGSRLFVNPDTIWHIREAGPDMTAIYASSGAALFVKGDVAHVAGEIADWRRANGSRMLFPNLRVVGDKE